MRENIRLDFFLKSQKYFKKIKQNVQLFDYILKLNLLIFNIYLDFLILKEIWMGSLKNCNFKYKLNFSKKIKYKDYEFFNIQWDFSIILDFIIWNQRLQNHAMINP
jgi:hypothetical protein